MLNSWRCGSYSVCLEQSKKKNNWTTTTNHLWGLLSYLSTKKAPKTAVWCPGRVYKTTLFFSGHLKTISLVVGCRYSWSARLPLSENRSCALGTPGHCEVGSIRSYSSKRWLCSVRAALMKWGNTHFYMQLYLPANLPGFYSEFSPGITARWASELQAAEGCWAGWWGAALDASGTAAISVVLTRAAPPVDLSSTTVTAL